MEYVWVLPKNASSDCPIGGYIMAKLGCRIKIKDDDLNEYWVSPEEILRPMHPTSVAGVEDMIHLGELQEYSILRNLQIRYSKDLIYTYIGSILVAVNPYKPLPIYGRAKMAEYRKKRLAELPPHIFAVADHSYESMRSMSQKRCIVISGESGAGKTESTKLFLQYFAEIARRLSAKEQQIFDSNPVLEAFGNAKTVRNDNSSRFGKYISISFNADGSIHSAQIKKYLLEKSRIVCQNDGEQNYHIFYAIINGFSAEEKQRLKLKTISNYNYLNKGRVKMLSPKEITLNSSIEIIKSAMKVLTFSEREIWSVFELIAAILHFGNIEFESVSLSNTETVNIASEEEIQAICTLLQVSKKNLLNSLTKSTISAHGDKIVKFLSKQEAINSRDAFVKKVFENLFNFIVEKINKVLFDEEKNFNGYIGILDIFGFEAFDRNSFEQLCINYASEKLQQFFIGHVFKIEQELYASEGIKWKFVEYPDNQDILDLIETGPKSVLSVINDATKIPKGTDQSMLDKLIEFNSENPFFLEPKCTRTTVFGIQHFAGVVLYDIKDFIEKNYDACSSDLSGIVRGSKNDFLKQIFANDFDPEFRSHPKKRIETLSSKFKNSLDSLMDELNECQPFFIRCIKPNEMKKPKKFDRTLCYKQLKYSGMTEVTKIREAGYPMRYDFVHFVQRYRVLIPGMPPSHKTVCKEATQRICRNVFRKFPNADYQLGRTKVFLKQAEQSLLEAEREKTLQCSAVIIQKLIRGWLVRRRLSKLKKAVVLVEKCWTERQQRIHEFESHWHLIRRLQAYCRGYLIRKLLKKKIEEAQSKKSAGSLEESNESADFIEFSKRYFQGKHDHRFSKKPIKSSLTCLICPEEIIAAKAIWLTILRYTGNIPEPRNDKANISFGAHLKECLQAINKTDGNLKATLQEVSNETGNAKKCDQLYEVWLETRMTHIQKINFIVGHAIGKPELRDEIYCQICKVLTKNPSHKATRRGWDLLTICTGCFPPSNLFFKYLKAFIRQGPRKYVSFCLFRLYRTIQNGSRTQPPSLTELQAIKIQKPINLEVYIKDGTTTLVKVDSATTAKEMLDVVTKNVCLKDIFGFSLFLVQDMRCLSLGNGSNFVLDAISECEQYILEIGGNFESMPWNLHLKREIFAPWHELIADEASIYLTYHQIKEGIITGEYGFDDKHLPFLIAQICYAEKGKLPPSDLKETIDHYIPPYFCNLSTDHLECVKKQAQVSYGKMFGNSERSVSSVQTEIVKYAALKWTTNFSMFFNVSGSIRSINSAQFYPEMPLVVGVNSTEVFFIDECNEKRVIVKMKYVEIREVTRSKVIEGQGYILKITNWYGMEISLIFHSTFDNDLFKLLSDIMETLKKYSKFVISVKNYKAQDKTFLELKKGDFITLTENFCVRDLLRNFWAKGWNHRNGKTGNFLLECVEIIPTIEKPPDNTIKAIREVILDEKKMQIRIQFAERLKHHNLESYANKYFKPITFKVGTEKYKNVPPAMWKYSTEELRQPLLAKIFNKNEEAKLATEVFHNILQYTESDKGIHTEEQLVSKIFTPGLENNELRDEIYCQLMKQLTSNINKESEKKTWELMWMITGLFACGEILANEVKQFLQSRRTHQIARECLERFFKILDTNARKYPPHVIEIEGIKNRPCHIFHRIYFPDNTQKFFQVNSLTKVKELKEAILTRLNMNLLKTKFCLFLQVLERLFLIPEDYYLFDYLQIFTKWTERSKISKKDYKICSMKCALKDSVPGSHKAEDLKFVFPQEYSKYIQGHYEIPPEIMIHLAALLCKAHYFNKTTQFQKILQKLIPSKAVDLMKSEVWLKEIQTSYKQYHLLSEEDRKIIFLRFLTELSSHTVPYFAPISETTNLTNYIFYPVTSNF